MGEEAGPRRYGGGTGPSTGVIQLPGGGGAGKGGLLGAFKFKLPKTSGGDTSVELVTKDQQQAAQEGQTVEGDTFQDSVTWLETRGLLTEAEKLDMKQEALVRRF
jgi:hypothetical protein